MDVIEFVVEDPLLLGIVDEEPYIGRYPIRLGGRQIGTDNLT